MFVPVKTKDGQQLMPMHAARARKLIKRGEATPYSDNGIYCVRLNKYILYSPAPYQAQVSTP